MLGSIDDADDEVQETLISVGPRLCTLAIHENPATKQNYPVTLGNEIKRICLCLAPRHKHMRFQLKDPQFTGGRFGIRRKRVSIWKPSYFIGGKQLHPSQIYRKRWRDDNFSFINFSNCGYLGRLVLMRQLSTTNIISIQGLSWFNVSIFNTKSNKNQIIRVPAIDHQHAISKAMSKHPLYKEGLSIGDQMSRFSKHGYYIYEPKRSDI